MLSSLIPVEVAAYAEIDPAAGRVSWNQAASMTLGFAEPERVFARHMGDLPLFKNYRRGDGSATKISDFMSQRQFRRTALYNEFYRRAGLDHQISKGLPGEPGLVTSVSLLRRGRDFSERDRLLLNLLRPHLNQAYRNAHTFDAMKTELAALRLGVEALDQGLVILDAAGGVLSMTARARQWIRDYFGSSAGDTLPASLASWVRHVRRSTAGDDAPPPREPLILERPGHQLTVRLVPTGDQSVLLLRRHQTEVAPDTLSALGLSRREAEALAWVMQGKTNAEIATILGTSTRTIHKHLERVFRKLGVETRTAAAACGLALLRS